MRCLPCHCTPRRNHKGDEDKVDGIRARFPVANAPVEASTPCTASLTKLDPVSEDEVKRVVMRSSTKSCPLDPMPTWLLKDVLPNVVPRMIDFINASLLSGVVPRTMKCAAITPLLKRPSLDAELLKNCRLVSNLPFISKVLERVVASRLKVHNGLHDPFQSVYKVAHGMETALLKVQNDILRTVDSGAVAVLVLLDLSAAFDTIDHAILLE